MNKISLSDCKRAFVSKRTSTVIDIIHPRLGIGIYGGQTLAECRAKNPDAEEMDFEEFCKWLAEQQRTPITWEETTQERFDDMMGILPPAAMTGNAFLVGEPSDHDAGNGMPRFQAYRRRGNAYQASSRPMTRKEFKEEITRT